MDGPEVGRCVDRAGRELAAIANPIEAKSEIVVPLMRGGVVLGGIDSDRVAAFSEDDRQMLERVAAVLAEKL